MSEFESEDRPARKSSNTVLYVLLGVGLVVLLVCGGGAFAVYWAISSAKQGLTNIAQTATIQAINQSDMEQEDKDDITAQINRVGDAYKNGDITLEQVGKILEKITEGSIITVGLCQHLHRRYVLPSGLTDEEKADALLTLQRTARGVYEKQISQSEFETAAAGIQTTDQNGKKSLKPSLTDEELRDFLEKCKALADSAGIPEEPYEVHIGVEVKQAVDDVLGVE